MHRSSSLVCSILLLVAAPILSAQEPPRPPTKPPAAAQKPNGWGEHDLALADVLVDYGKLIGKKIVQDNTISGGSPVTLPDLEGTEPARRASLIGQALFLNGYSLVDADKDTVIILGPGKIPRSVGLPLYTNPEEWPTDERVFSYAIKLEHSDAIEMAGVLTQMIPGGNTVNFTASPKKRIVIATAQTSVMRMVLRIVATLDVDSKDGPGR